MDTMRAMIMGDAHRHEPLRVFDWNMAAHILLERKAKSAVAGLSGDLEWTGGVIWEDGKPRKDSYCYLTSTWATPVLVIKSDNYWGDDEEINCWCWQKDSEWTPGTIWPESALAIINGQSNGV